MTTPSDTAIAILDAAIRALGDAEQRLARVRTEAGALARETAWHARSARAYRTRMQEWDAAALRAIMRIADVRDELATHRAIVRAHAGPGG